MSLFNRSYRLEITSRKDILVDTIRPTPSVDSSLAGSPNVSSINVYNKATAGVSIEGLQMIAKVGENSTNSNGDFTEIKVYNLPEEAMNKLSIPDSVISLKAGYSTEHPDSYDLPLIFYGDVISSETYKENSEIITTIRASNLAVPNRESYISKSYFGKNLQQMVEDIVQNYYKGINIGEIKLRKEDFLKTLQTRSLTGELYDLQDLEEDVGLAEVAKGLDSNSFLKYRSEVANVSDNPVLGYGNTELHGRVSNVLDKLKKEYRFEYYVIKNNFYAYPIGFEPPKEVYVVNPEDVIGSVEVAQNSTKSTEHSSKVTIKILLDPSISPKNNILLAGFNEKYSKQFNGEYNVLQTSHELDYRGNNWYTTIEMAGINQ